MKFKRGLAPKESLNIGRYRYHIKLLNLVSDSCVACFRKDNMKELFNERINSETAQIKISEEDLNTDIIIRIRKSGWMPIEWIRYVWENLDNNNRIDEITVCQVEDIWIK